METHWENFKASSSYSQRSHFYRKTSAQTECIYRHSDTRGAKQAANCHIPAFKNGMMWLYKLFTKKIKSASGSGRGLLLQMALPFVCQNLPILS